MGIKPPKRQVRAQATQCATQQPITERAHEKGELLSSSTVAVAGPSKRGRPASVESEDDDCPRKKRRAKDDKAPPNVEPNEESAGMQRDKWWSDGPMTWTEENELEFQKVKAETLREKVELNANPSGLFRREYHVFKKRGLTNWRDIHPNIVDMPPGWPGKGLEHGLREEHLVPSYWRKIYKGKNRNERGLRIDANGVPCDELERAVYEKATLLGLTVSGSGAPIKIEVGAKKEYNESEVVKGKKRQLSI